MADKQGAPTFAILGEVDDELLAQVSGVGRMSRLTSAGTASSPTMSLQGLRAVVVGRDVDGELLARWLPSLRTANPTLVVLSVAGGLDARLAETWVDEVSQDAAVMRERLAEIAGHRNGSAAVVRHAVSQLTVQFAALFALVAVWWLAVAAWSPPAYLLPSPVAVWLAFSAQADRFAGHLFVTAFEAALGFALGNGLGLAAAVALHRFVRAQRFAIPVLIGLQAIPIVAFAPLLGVWMGTGLAGKVTMAAIICFFPIVINTLHAFLAVDREYLELFSLSRAGYGMTLRRLLIPASAPAIIAGLKISAGLSVVGAIVAEMTGAERGLGYLILNGAYRLETDLLFVAMVLSGLLGLAFFHLPDVLRALLPRSWAGGLGGEVQGQTR